MNTQINITENGTLTLATAGTYCDRNIDVEVNIPKYDDELVKANITEFKSRTAKWVGVYGLGYKNYLRKVDLWSVKSIAEKAFYNDFALDTLIIRTPKVCSLYDTTTTLYRTPIENGTGYIYVPDDLVESYKVATNWVAFADQIKPISELEE